MSGLPHLELDADDDDSEFVEVDPTGRYGRYTAILGKGASKTVYRAFDEYEGIEVAWNQVKLYDFLQSPEDLERLYCEIHLLKTLKHQNIMKFYTSWVDTGNRNINFVTEMFTSGTLRQYRQKHKRVNIRAVKHWCRQILRGLLYLHSHDPPVIHRDLKCDNIFINGNQGEVKIGDLGLAAILRKSHAAHCVGTPEFMAPEVYEEEYNELVDIYSFGMCILEMVTFDYPYSECTHPAQIYKKVISGKKPDALYKVKDAEVREFVEKCLATVSLRLSARELLEHPFLQTDDCPSILRPIEYRREQYHIDPPLGDPFLEHDYEGKSISNSSFNGVAFEALNGWGLGDTNGWELHHPTEVEQSGIELFEYNDDEHEEHLEHVDIIIKGKRGEDGNIFLRLRIADKEGRIRNIYFPFDVDNDTALSVATEMVGELDITDQDVTKIADMIDGEIARLVPEWLPGSGIEETPHFANSSYCYNCASNQTSSGSFTNFLSGNPTTKIVQISNCCGNGCAAATHGRFEEITYQVGSPQQYAFDCTANDPLLVGETDGFHDCTDIWDHSESRECSSLGSEENHSVEDHETLNDNEKIGLEVNVPDLLPSCDLPNDYYEIENQQDLRWLKAKYQKELSEFRDQQLGHALKSSQQHSSSPGGCKREIDHEISVSSVSVPLERSKNGTLLTFSHSEESPNSVFHGQIRKSCHDLVLPKWETIKESPNAEDMVPAASSFFAKSFLLNTTLHRTTSLPVDAVDL